MSCPEKDFEIVAGDTFKLQTTIRDMSYVPIDVSGYDAILNLRKDKSQPVADFTFSSTIAISDGVLGRFNITLSNSDTQQLISSIQESNDFNYLLVSMDTDGNRESILQGVLTVLQPITR